MSDASEDSESKAKRMFDSISHVLNPESGRYVCVTLAESFIFKALMEYFSSPEGMGTEGMKCCWSVSIDVVRGTRKSPFLPLFITAMKSLERGSRTDESHGKIMVSFDTITGAELASSCSISYQEALERVPRLQDYTQKQFDLGPIRIGRFDSMELWTPEESSVPRFTIFVLDCDTHAPTRTCAVFFIPRGREAEYQFSTVGGLAGIAQQASCRRLFAVRCNRPHEFGSNTELQDELNPMINSLRPWDMESNPDEQIPYMAIQADEGWETLEEDISEISGPYVVEEKDAEGRSDAVVRRLVFLQNQSFVQTETRLIVNRSRGGMNIRGRNKGKAKGKSKGKTKGKSKEKEKLEVESHFREGEDFAPVDDFEFDFSYLDYHHRCFLASIVLSPSIIQRACSNISTTPKDREIPPQVVVVGFAGGAVCMSLQKYLPQAYLTVIDLDGNFQNRLARMYFGFKPTIRTRIVQGEGVATLREMLNPQHMATSGVHSEVAMEKLSIEKCTGRVVDLLFIDADCKDLSLGMSAPPASFVTEDMLHGNGTLCVISSFLFLIFLYPTFLHDCQVMHNLLSEEGILVINVVARMESLLYALAAEVQKVFSGGTLNSKETGAVYIIRADEETVNVALVAVKRDCDKGVITGGSSGGKKSRARWNTLDNWLRAVGMASDPLDLSEHLEKIEPVDIDGAHAIQDTVAHARTSLNDQD